MKRIFIKLLALTLLLPAVACVDNEIYVPAIPDSEFPVKPITPSSGITLYGWVADENGKGIQNVVVTDGYNVVLTDVEGVYQMVRSQDAAFVYISVPAEYEIPASKGFGSYAGFYDKINTASTRQRSDFYLTKREKDSKDFTLFVLGDPQPSKLSDTDRFRDETIVDLKKEALKIGVTAPKVALSMGDNSAGSKSASDKLHELTKQYMGSSGIPFYTTVGNHDKSDLGVDDGEMFSETFGPLYYSFNMGDVHFVCLDNCRFDSPGGTYKTRFTDEELAWLQKDLSYVPKTKKVILYYHIDVQNNNAYTNTKAVFDLISGYTEPVAMCGHTHNMQYSTVTLGTKHVPQVIHSAACGYFWRSTVNGDGVPNGYFVYDISGTTITNARFKATNRDKDFQIRLYRGDGVFSNVRYELGADYIVANVFFANAFGGNWKIEVLENNVLSGEMEKMSNSDKDLWAYGYHVGVCNHPTTSASTPNYHQYKYKLKNPSAKVTVRATDGFGNIFTRSEITESGNFTEAAGYN